MTSPGIRHTSADTSAAHAAARLVRYSLRPTLLPEGDDDYRELFARYRTDEEFRATVDALISGLGLVRLDVTHDGVFLAPAGIESPFSFRAGDMVSGLENRLLVGLVHVGIAAAAYPRIEDLEADNVVRLSIATVDDLLRRACIAIQLGEDDDEHVALAFEAYLAKPQVRYATRRNKGSLTSDCTHGLIQRAFRLLVEQGMARETADADRFLLLDRYRAQVRELAGHNLYEALTELAGTTDGEPDEVGA